LLICCDAKQLENMKADPVLHYLPISEVAVFGSNQCSSRLCSRFGTSNGWVVPRF
jgi:hypothetical protein